MGIMGQDTLDKLHIILLELIDEFVRICEENKLTYFLYAGTLLGAVRHKGFIPWDDDVDIAMPREDYEKFLDIFQNDIRGAKYYVLSDRCPIDSFWHYIPFAKFCKKNTVFAEKNAPSGDYPPGIFIDIFPYDNCVPFLASLQARLIWLFSKMYRIKTLYDYSRKKKGFVLFFARVFRCFYPMQLARMLYKKSCTLFNRLNTKKVCFFYNHHQRWKEIQKRDVIFPLSKIPFEGRYYCVPGNYDSFLRVYYDDYMEVPPPGERVTHEPKYIIFGDEEKD